MENFDTTKKIDDRKNEGMFYTPKVWVDEAYKRLDAVLGSGWRDSFIVYDSSAGSGNLTRGRGLKNCYSSSLKEDEVALIEDGVKFKKDFINSSLFEGMPKDIEAGVISGKSLLLINNPPYATSGERGAKGKHKAGVAKSVVNQEMLKAKLGKCSSQLYAQFMFRLLKLAEINNNCTIALFIPYKWLTIETLINIREMYKNASYNVVDSFMFPVSEFDGCTGQWGVGFFIIQKVARDDWIDFSADVLENKDGVVSCVGKKKPFNFDNKAFTPANIWVREKIKGMKRVDAPQMQNALKIRPDGRGSIIAEAISYNNARDRWVVCGGSMLNSGNRADETRDGVGITSSNSSKGNEVPVFGSLLNNGNTCNFSQDMTGVYSGPFSGWTSVPVFANCIGNANNAGSTPSSNEMTNITSSNASFKGSCPCIGSIHNLGNTLNHSTGYVGLTSSNFSDGHEVPVIGSMYNHYNVVNTNKDGVSITSSNNAQPNYVSIAGNVLECVALFSARKLTKVTWVNDSDVYSKPDIEHPDYKQWNYDCLVNAVISNSSLQSSMRDIDYKEKKWDIINQWFPFSVNFIKGLAIKHNNVAILNSIKDYGEERFIYKALCSVHLSEDAVAVLRLYASCIERVFNRFEEWHLKYGHLDVWDFGWYQFRVPLKQEEPELYKELLKVIKPFQARLAKGIYTFNFLREYIGKSEKVVNKKGMWCESIF